MRTVIHDVYDLGQSIWLDTISRGLIEKGGLREWIEQGVTGVTTNPSIFEAAIASRGEYDADIAALARAGRSAAEIYEELTVREVGAAADIMRDVYDRTGGVDGFVSLEVNPLIAGDRDTTVSEALRLSSLLARPNVMIKIPATPEGIEALEACVEAGVNINSTLIFSTEQYEAVAEAYVSALEKRAAKGLPLQVASVASVFVSRVDTAVDKLLAEREKTLCGHIACDNICRTYGRFREIFHGSRWDALAAKGARVQRPLWASTGTKNPAYSDVKYIDELIASQTVNTVPPATLSAFIGHGKAALSLEADVIGADARLKRASELGVNLDAVCASLLSDGLKAFADAFRSLMRTIETAGTAGS